MEEFSMRRKLALVSATVALGALLVVGGTMAYFTGTDSKTNIITTYGENGEGLNGDIHVEENLPTNPDGYEVVDNGNGITYNKVKPGMVIEKDPTVKYTGNTDAFVRYKIVATVGDEDIFDKLTFYLNGEVVKPMEAGTDADKVVGIDAAGKACVYYKTAWKENESKLLFDKVQFNGKDFGNDFAGGEIKVIADAVSAEGFENATQTADGWVLTVAAEGADNWNGTAVEAAPAKQ